MDVENLKRKRGWRNMEKKQDSSGELPAELQGQELLGELADEYVMMQIQMIVVMVFDSRHSDGLVVHARCGGGANGNN